jgi:hypothetical protein
MAAGLADFARAMAVMGVVVRGVMMLIYAMVVAVRV